LTKLAKQFSTKAKYQGNLSAGLPMLIVSAPQSELTSALKEMPGVEYVEEDSRLDATPETVASRSDQNSWGLLRIDSNNSAGKTGPGQAAAGQSVHVYIMDTGIRTKHQEFDGGRAVPTLEVDNLNLKECMGAHNCAADNNGHGTHAAATVGGKTVGVAPGATMHAVKVLDDEGTGSYANVLMAMDWILQHGKRPAVMLTGTTSDSNVDASRSLKDAIDKAAADGVSVVVGAGDSTANACKSTPAFVPSAVTVGATTENDQLLSSSNFGSCLDLLAPGTNIKTADVLSDVGLVSVSGTSMAAAHAAGAMAVSMAADPSKTAKEITTQLISTSTIGAVQGNVQGSPNKLLKLDITKR